MGGLFKDSKSIKEKSDSLQSDGFTTFIPTVGDGLMLKYKNWYMLQEKTLSDSEIENLIDKSQKGVQRVIDDTDRDESERKQGREVLKWIEGVRKTWEKEGSLHPNVVNSLMRTVTGVQSGRYGYMVRNGSKKVPPDYRRK